MTSKQHLISVDPGNSGAFAVFDIKTKERLRVECLPTKLDLDGKKIINASKFLDIISEYDALLVCERLWGMNRSKSKNKKNNRIDTPKTAFSMGRSYQTILIAAELAGFDFQNVCPSVWKKDMDMTGLSKDEVSKIIAAKIPEHDFKKGLYKGHRSWNHDKAEAVAIGLWALKRLA